ncbi:hypothetical protein OIU77_004784 [Salix suchowensis]|uniref:Uncharacterized protein n=1 Tax=Salix suchowensis TaxID=1278906 RepID=A0ABQ9AX79_9ROSI|nr:hypothetical protein OIU77_004784 [Salix suchowensis]
MQQYHINLFNRLQRTCVQICLKNEGKVESFFLINPIIYLFKGKSYVIL